MRSLNRDSSVVYQDLSRVNATGYEVRSLLTELDRLQTEEKISPQLAETVRIAMHQMASENPSGFLDRAGKAFPSRIKYFTANMDDAEIHIMKAAEKLEKETDGNVSSGQVVNEFIAWQQRVDD